MAQVCGQEEVPKVQTEINKRLGVGPSVGRNTCGEKAAPVEISPTNTTTAMIGSDLRLDAC